jgi:putative endonuclease
MYHNYYVYILTNIHKQVLYTGVTNDLRRRLSEHTGSIEGNRKIFTAKYNCTYLIHWEHFRYINDAIAREKEIKGWTRAKKLTLIKTLNPSLNFLNDEI